MTNNTTNPSDVQAACMHLIDTGGPGGAETMFQQIAFRLNGRPLRSVTVIPREGWLSSSLRSRALDPLIVDVRGSMNFSYLTKLFRIAKRNNTKVIHAHLLGSSVYGALLGGILRIPVIAVFHGPTDLKSPGRFAVMKRFLLSNCCSRLVAVSQGTRQSLIDFGIKESKITVIPNGIEVSSYSPSQSIDLREELRLGADDVLIGAVGNIRKPKAYDVLIRAAALVFAKKSNVHFAVVGDGDQQAMSSLLELRDSLGIQKRFHFLGFRKASSTLFGNFNIFVSSSRSEGLPLSFLEAMATGLCVVATASGGPQELIVNEQTGLLVPIENPTALASALDRAVSDVDLRLRLAAAGREKVHNEYSLDATIEKYAQLYREVLQ